MKARPKYGRTKNAGLNKEVGSTQRVGGCFAWEHTLSALFDLKYTGAKNNWGAKGYCCHIPVNK